MKTGVPLIVSAPDIDSMPVGALNVPPLSVNPPDTLIFPLVVLKVPPLTLNAAMLVPFGTRKLPEVKDNVPLTKNDV